MNKNNIILSVLAVVIILVALPPLSPIFFTNASEKGAIRHEIYQSGYPYQSYFAILQKRDANPVDGQLYYIVWNAWKSETGMTPFLCYSKKGKKSKYKVSCGTAP
ncbi:hypothetical protein [Bacillus sp. NPDC077027]|uniref:hypothetical protein n=1 Tax=Bacillus sp. NPDC077027 TaxID=3390548 RepID=UPI003CFF098F